MNQAQNVLNVKKEYLRHCKQVLMARSNRMTIMCGFKFVSIPLFNLPAGLIIPFGGPVVPPGYLLCDGSAVSRSSYGALFAACGTAWGSGDGSTTFNLPNLQGYFLRGVDNGAGVDPESGSRYALQSGGNSGDQVGSYQGSQFSDHSHGFAWHPREPTGAGNGPNGWTWDPGDNGQVSHNGGSETRPINAYVNYLIKY